MNEFQVKLQKGKSKKITNKYHQSKEQVKTISVLFLIFFFRKYKKTEA